MTVTRSPSPPELWTTTTVGEVMRPGMVACPPGTGIAAVAAAMVAHGVHAVIVAPASGHIPLVVTDLELVAGALRGGNPRAGELAGEPIATVAADAPLREAVEMMVVRSVSHLLVLDPLSGDGAGVLSTLDLAAMAAGVNPRLARILRPAPARPSPSARDVDHAKVSDVMHAGVTACDPTTPISTVARIMADHRSHCSAVTGIDASPGREHRLTWALVDDMDVLGAVHRGQLDSPVSSIADTTPIAVLDSDSLARAAALMTEHQRRHLVAVGSSRLPCGMVSTIDVARVIANR